MTFEYYLPTHIVFGNDSISKIADSIKSLVPQTKTIFLITGRRSMRQTGLYDKLLKLLQNYDVFLFDNVESGPTAHTLNDALAEFKKKPADVILAVGGGSVMDLGKAVAVLANNEGKLADYQSGAKLLHDAVPYIAVPTTIGTASEMTVWSVIINSEGPYVGKRKSFSDPKMYPKLAVIDPQLTLSLPLKETMGTALDILSSSVESIWSRKANPISTVFAVAALKGAAVAIPKVVNDLHDPVAKEELALACLYSGFAVSNSRTGMPHKISYPLTSHFRLQHGAACALTLPFFLEFYGEKDVPAVKVVVDALGASDYKEAANILRSLVEMCDMPTRLSMIGVDVPTIDYIVHEAYVPEAQQEDPIRLSRDDLKSILQAAM